jgi:hypothetical protein
MARVGVADNVAERVLGHAITGVHGIYNRHDYLAEKNDALQRLATLVETIINPPETTNVVELAAPSLRADSLGKAFPSRPAGLFETVRVPPKSLAEGLGWGAPVPPTWRLRVRRFCVAGFLRFCGRGMLCAHRLARSPHFARCARHRRHFPPWVFSSRPSRLRPLRGMARSPVAL